MRGLFIQQLQFRALQPNAKQGLYSKAHVSNVSKLPSGRHFPKSGLPVLVRSKLAGQPPESNPDRKLLQEQHGSSALRDLHLRMRKLHSGLSNSCIYASGRPTGPRAS
jgi:hypothetical protein